MFSLVSYFAQKYTSNMDKKSQTLQEEAENPEGLFES